jgi:Domain of unknown function (DUF4267)
MDHRQHKHTPWRSAGVWMATLIAFFMALNTWRSASDPAGFARYFGIAAAGEGHPAFVYVYASRAFFLGLITAILIWRHQFTALTWFAGTAIIMPLSDAWQVSQADGGNAIVMRHLAVAAYLALTAFLLHRWNNDHG